MRYSCNGCRVLRKGCSEDCCIRPSIEWIKSPEAQSNATLFLAKFYGRAGLLNLLSAGPDHLRPAIFRSLLQEACGRIVNPIYGSSGLISTGSWHLCESAVEAVLNGSPITQISIESAVQCESPVFKACDIRHVAKKNKEEQEPKVKNQTRFKKLKPNSVTVQPDVLSLTRSRSSGSESGSVETVEDTLAKPNNNVSVGLDLALGFNSGLARKETYGSGEASGLLELTLGLPQVY